MPNSCMAKKLSSNIKKNNKSTSLISNKDRIDAVYQRITEQIQISKDKIIRSINTEMVFTYWHIGKEIVEEELQGKKRAGYGETIIKGLSERLTNGFGKGFTVTNLKYMRLFYQAFPERIGHALRDQLGQVSEFSPNLSWTHYRLLIKVSSKAARSFYEQEAIINHWSSRELERQINSLLFERLAKSRDKAGLMRLAKRGQEVQQPEDAIKDPFVLEFLSLPESHRLVESKLEEALLTSSPA